MCWHRWSKWEQYEEHMEYVKLAGEYIGKVIPFIEKKQKRICLKCNKVQIVVIEKVF